MERDGYEADKNDLIVRRGDIEWILQNIGTEPYKVINGAMMVTRIYFNAPVGGTIQLFEVDVNFKMRKMPFIKQITKVILTLQSKNCRK